jgi:hypothetical protein
VKLTAHKVKNIGLDSGNTHTAAQDADLESGCSSAQIGYGEMKMFDYTQWKAVSMASSEKAVELDFGSNQWVAVENIGIERRRHMDDIGFDWGLHHLGEAVVACTHSDPQPRSSGNHVHRDNQTRDAVAGVEVVVDLESSCWIRPEYRNIWKDSSPSLWVIQNCRRGN